MHFPTAFGPSQAVSFALERNLRGFFSSGFVFETPLHSYKYVYLPESEKGVTFNSYKSERASIVCITKAVVPLAQTRKIILRDTPVSMGIR